MLRVNRVLWGEGMFLRPQHFQQQELFTEQAIAQVLRQIHAHPWGIRSVDIDSDALRAGLLRVNALDLIYPDGMHISAPGNDPLPAARSLADIPQLGTETRIFACLPVLNAFGGNSSDPHAATSRPARFSSEQVAVPDLYTNALETEVTALRANIRLLVEQENRDGYQCIPIARLCKNATGVWTVDESYVAPLVTLQGSALLGTMIRRLLDQGVPGIRKLCVGPDQLPHGPQRLVRR